jgi:hypothetical protein
MNRFMNAIEAYQGRVKNRPAVATLSLGFDLPNSLLNPIMVNNPDIFDFGPVFLDRLARSNVAFITSAGNSGEDDLAKSALLVKTPQTHSAPGSSMIVVGGKSPSLC